MHDNIRYSTQHMIMEVAHDVNQHAPIHRLCRFEHWACGQPPAGLIHSPSFPAQYLSKHDYRYGLLAGCALFQGATLGPLVKIVLATHPGILVTAFLGTSVIFACFSAAALLSRRRRYAVCQSCFLGSALYVTLVSLAELKQHF